jgi:FtsZ-binding cell division protein ZapB
MNNQRTIERLDQLETRITRAVEVVTSLRSECKTLRGKKQELEHKIAELIESNNELNNQINDLKSLHEKSSKSFDKEEVRKKIDHMLEKFGELQL